MGEKVLRNYPKIPKEKKKYTKTRFKKCKRDLLMEYFQKRKVSIQVISVLNLVLCAVYVKRI